MALYSNELKVLRHYVATRVGDLIRGQCGTTGATVNKIHAPFLWQPDDYYNENFYEVYIYAGTNIGLTRRVTDWVLTTELLSVHSDYTAACDTSSYAELHRIFNAEEYNMAIGLAIEHLIRRYLIDVRDETIVFTRTAEHDDSSSYIYTAEYSLPTSMLYVHKVTLEHGVSGKRLWSSISTDFVVDETVTGGTSDASGLVSYQPSGDDYLCVREISGTFQTGETLSGSTAGVGGAVSSIDDITAGDTRYLDQDVFDDEDWGIVKATTAKIQFRLARIGQGQTDRHIRIEGQGTQALLTSDTSVCYLPAEWIVSKAITLLPYSKIESANLAEAFKVAERQARYEPYRGAYARAKSVVE